MEKRMIQKMGLAFKILIPVGMVLFISIFIWSEVTINIQKKALIEKAISDVDKFCNTVLNFTWFAMLHNPNKDMPGVLKSMSKYNQIEKIRLFDAHGKIKFSNNNGEINTVVKKSDIACKTCHFEKIPVVKTDIKERIRIFKSPEGELFLGIINPILNESGCATADCHYHPKAIKKIGTLDVIVSLKSITSAIKGTKKLSAWTAVYLFIVLCITIWFCIFRLVTNPINKLINHTALIGKGTYHNDVNGLVQGDEIGKLSLAIKDMGEKIKNKQEECNKQKDRYQNLFDQVPCTITVQNKDYKLIEFNKEFLKKFNPEYGDYCYFAYKNLNRKCNNCPVERTFIDGKSHFSEESGINKDGTIAHWFVKTAPIRDEEGNIVAAVEMSIDISRRKKLEEIVKDSERKYQAIFKSIPNPVFILNIDNYNILNCNNSALTIYGYTKGELENKAFSILFPQAEAFENFKSQINKPFHERLVNIKKTGENLFVNIWVSPAEFTEQKVLLVTVIDITLSVETEQQLIQAGKMATLGEMATGVAHELNQPLSVIKTASSFISRKIGRNEPIDTHILNTLSQEIESHVDRASKITNHMRLFGRKSKFSKEAVNINDTIKRAFDIFSQQLKLREIDVKWELDNALPQIVADPVRLEQVFINLLLNARDSIVTRFEKNEEDKIKQITITTSSNQGVVCASIADTGTGIPKPVMDKIFEPFFTTKKVGEGTGLGLSISYGIIKDSGGEISVKNNPEGGVTFTIRFHATPKEY
ncbi:MAG: PAS domain S-box protein [Proteobacteria bacterium]|nr:PAS domain S-box protein [Pseudomonadota bacterium]MBU1581214.1 PAS domain S-box protein [Pseudomonadota bacterium]MBU2631262.1 PAS domain S-box protein [Pseudomonadota bacterium]